MEELIREIVKYYELFEKLGPILFFAKDLHGRYIYGNTAFVKFAGGKQTVYYKRTEEIFPDSMRQMKMLQEEDTKLISGEKEISIRRSDLKNSKGTPVSLIVAKLPATGEKSGNIVGILGLGIDITLFKNGFFVLFEKYLKRLSPQERTYFFEMSRKLSRKDIAKVMNIFEEHGDKIKSEILRKLDLKDQPEEISLILRIYRMLMSDNYNE